MLNKIIEKVINDRGEFYLKVNEGTYMKISRHSKMDSPRTKKIWFSVLWSHRNHPDSMASDYLDKYILSTTFGTRGTEASKADWLRSKLKEQERQLKSTQYSVDSIKRHIKEIKKELENG